jgi:hypothetical protein
MTLFSKDKNADSANLALAFSIDADGKLRTTIGAADGVTSTSAIPADPVAWTFVEYSISIDASLVDTNAQFSINGGTAETKKITGAVFTETDPITKAYLAVQRTPAKADKAQGFTGFIYKLHIYNAAQSGKSALYGNTGCDTCNGEKCTD